MNDSSQILFRRIVSLHRPVHRRCLSCWDWPDVRPLRHRPRAQLPGVRAVRQSGRQSRRARPAIPAVRSWAARRFVVNLLGNCYVLDLRLDQEYLRSQPVNSEEGAPMGIGIWYEMWISDPVSYLFKNTDPRGSLRANVSNATVRCLSNMPLAEMLETRHAMSQTVRSEVRRKSQAWGYQARLGVHPQGAFPRCRDDPADRGEGGEPAAAGDVGDQAGRRQPGQRDHQFGRAGGGRRIRQGAAIRPSIVGEALNQVAADPEVERRCLRSWKSKKSSRARRGSR